MCEARVVSFTYRGELVLDFASMKGFILAIINGAVFEIISFASHTVRVGSDDLFPFHSQAICVGEPSLILMNVFCSWPSRVRVCLLSSKSGYTRHGQSHCGYTASKGSTFSNSAICCLSMYGKEVPFL